MATKSHQKETTKDFVRRILTQTFNQHVDADTLRDVTEKVSAVIPKQPAAKDEHKRAASNKAA